MGGLLVEAEELRDVEGVTHSLDVFRDVGSDVHAESEFRFHEGLRTHGFTCWAVNHPVRLASGRTAFIDATLPGSMVRVEVDGDHHSDGDSIEHD